MKQPPSFIENGKEELVCVLQKDLYGLKQEAKSWYDELNKTLIEANFAQSNADPCLYITSNNEWCFLVVYVDDIIIATRTNGVIDKIKDNISSNFQIQDLGNIKLYLGIEVINQRSTRVLLKSIQIHSKGDG